MKDQQKEFPDIGFGLGLRPPHYDYIFEHKPDIDWFEIISENYMETDGRPRRMLDRILEDYPVVMHGVSLSIGTVDPLNSDYLQKLKALAEHVNPPWISDHLAWTGVAHKNTHDLLPVPYTEQALKHIIQRIKDVQDFLGRQIVLENPSTYLEFRSSSIPEWEFIAEMAKESGCGLLLDVNNIYVSCYNHKWDPKTYIDAIPLDHVAQIHLAGHTNNGTHIVDTHDDHVIDEVWALYRYAIAKGGPISTMIEWDADIPEFPVVMAELDKARHWRAEPVGPDLKLPEFKAFLDNVRPHLTPLDMGDEMDTMQMAILSGEGDVMNPDETIVPKPDFSPEDQIEVYIQGYRHRLFDMVFDEYPALRKYLGREKFVDLVQQFVENTPSEYFNLSRYVEKFPLFAAEKDLDTFAQELVVLETNISRIADAEETSVLDADELAGLTAEQFEQSKIMPRKAMMLLACANDINTFYTEAVQEEADKPMVQKDTPTYIALYRHEDRVLRLPLQEEEYFLLASLFAEVPVGKALDSVFPDEETGQAAEENLQVWFSRWMNNGLLSAVA